MTLSARLNNVLVKLLLLQETSGVDYSRDRISHGSGGHGAHGDPSKKPSGNSRPLVYQWAERFDKMIERAEIDAGIRAADEGVGHRDKYAHIKGKLAEYEGYTSADVAFYERVSAELVRKVRRDAGRDVFTGERKQRNERPLTARPRDSLQMLQNTIGGEL